MPNLVRKLLIFAAVDGIILQPSSPRNHHPLATQQAIKVDYKGNVGPALKDGQDVEATSSALEAHGIIGRSRSHGGKRWLCTTPHCRDPAHPSHTRSDHPA